MVGQVTSVSVAQSGDSVYIVFDGMGVGGTANLGSVSNTPPSDSSPNSWLVVTSSGYGYDSTARQRVRIVPLTRQSLTSDVSGTVLDSSLVSGGVKVRFQLAEIISSSDVVTAVIGYGTYVQNGVYSEQFSGAVVNGSTSPVVTPIASWAWDSVPAFQRVTSDFTLAVTAYAAYGVSCVKFIATGVTSGVTVESVVWKSQSNATGSGLHSEQYRTTVPISSFTDGENIICRYVVYPYIGTPLDSSAITDKDRAASGCINITVTKDTSGTLTTFAVVSTTGSDTTGTSSQILSTASASPFLTIGKALASGASVVYCRAGTHDILGSVPASVPAKTYAVVVKPYPGETVTLNRSGTWRAYRAAILLYSGFTINCASASGYLDGENRVGAYLLFSNCIFTGTVTPSPGLGYRSAMTMSTNCRWEFFDHLTDYSTARSAYVFVGCTFTVGLDSRPANMVACLISGGAVDKVRIYGKTANNPLGHNNNVIWANNNLIGCQSSSSKVMNCLDEVNQNGFACIGNIIEAKLYGASPIVSFGGDGSTTNVINFLMFHNTVVGGRSNILYNDAAPSANVRVNCFVQGNALSNYNIKGYKFVHPTYGASSARIGNWAQMNGCNYRNNRYDASNSTAFTGDYAGINTMFVVDAQQVYGQLGFVNDRSYFSGGLGGGDYTPSSNSVLRGHDRRFENVRFDLFGNPLGSSQ